MAVRPIDANAMLNELRPVGFEAEHSVILLSDVSKMMREWVERQPTLTQPNEWVSVEDEIPSDDDDGLEFFCMTNATGKCGGVLPLEWEVATIRGKTVRRWKWVNRISPWAVTHWMKRPAPPGENNNVPTKAPNEPLTLEQLRQMEGQWIIIKAFDSEISGIMPAFIKDQFATTLCELGSKAIVPDLCEVHFSFNEYGKTWIAYRRPPEGEA